MKRLVKSIALLTLLALSEVGLVAQSSGRGQDTLYSIHEDDLKALVESLSKSRKTSQLTSLDLLRYQLILNFLNTPTATNTIVQQGTTTPQKIEIELTGGSNSRRVRTAKNGNTIVYIDDNQPTQVAEPLSLRNTKRKGKVSKRDTVYIQGPTQMKRDTVYLAGNTALTTVTPLTTTISRVDTVRLAAPETFSRRVYFAQNSSELDKTSQGILQEVLVYLKQNPKASLRLRGFASPEGSPERNKVLARERRERVATALTTLGISSQRLHQEDIQTLDGETSDPTLSRRVELSLYRGEVEASIYDYAAQTSQGERLDMRQLEGKVILIVNTASKCGLTPQYEGLESLYDQYKDEGLVILGFPCNQFGSQEPGSNEEIAEFCERNYGVSFPIMDKVEVNGDNAHPLYKYLKAVAGGWQNEDIKWNFTKFLISKDGKTIKRFAPTVKPSDLESDIEQMLAK